MTEKTLVKQIEDQLTKFGEAVADDFEELGPPLTADQVSYIDNLTKYSILDLGKTELPGAIEALNTIAYQRQNEFDALKELAELESLDDISLDLQTSSISGELANIINEKLRGKVSGESTTAPTPVVVVPESTPAPSKPETINLFNKDTHGKAEGGLQAGKWINEHGVWYDNGALSVTGPIPVKAGVTYHYNVNVNWYNKDMFYVDFSETENKDDTRGQSIQVKATNGGAGVAVADRWAEFEVPKDGYVRLNIDNATLNKMMLAPKDGYPDKYLAYGEVPEDYETPAGSSESTPTVQPETVTVNARFVNRLTGKKWYAYGDSYTEALSAVEKDDEGNLKGYWWHIATRNGMLGANKGESGSWLVKDDSRSFNQGFATTNAKTNYTQIPDDANYITLAFGLNEFNYHEKNLGTKESTDPTTLWGAYYTVFNAILTKNPKVKIGVILMPAWQRAGYREAVKEICSYWGVPVLDMKDYTKVPMWYSNPTVDKDTTLAKARGPRAAVFMDPTEHPNAAGHEFMSTIVENFLFSL